MKKAVAMVMAVCAVLFLSTSVTHAAATVPNPVSFSPNDAAVGAPITLSALIYNNQPGTVTVTVSFNSATDTVATATASIPSQTAKTVSAAWTMPAQNTIITATVAAAINSDKQSVSTLLGPVGSVTVGTGILNSVTISAWFNNAFTTIEQFRTQQAAAFTSLRNTTSATITSSTSQAFGTPFNYLVLIYATIGVVIFSTALFFYIVAILVALLLIRFILDLIF